ncbi:unnamed protein product [Chironomus riparius]|uniref:Uncharacterized protein n=1 Tax=Chironomus riparius TaxID=315576 RepID=A0A9N9WX51_9DIPT|nr:unnamed protein product [Chironomus riparius]
MKCFIKFAIIFLIFIKSQQCHKDEEVSFDVFSLISSQVDFLEDMCLNRTGDKDIFDRLEQTIAECREELLNETPLSLTFRDLLTTDPKEFYELYTTQCNNKNATRVRNECNDKLKSLLSQCLNGTEIEAFDKIEDIASRLYEVICRIDQDEMKNFFSQKGQECMIDNVITIGYCYLSAMPDNVHEKQEMLFNLMEGKECTVIDEIENCIMTEIDACEEQSVSHIFHLLFKHFRNQLLCDRLPEDTRLVSSGSINISGSISDFIRISLFLLTSRFLVTKS